MKPDEIRKVFAKRPINFVYVDARERFLKKLTGVTDPEAEAQDHRRGIRAHV